jgi:hypothetical protein
MLEELDELQGRLNRLEVFIEDAPGFRELEKADQRLLVDQRHAMSIYRDILRRRIERIT